jgi:hypothetical protein
MFRFVTVSTLVTGTMFLMWLGEQITERGFGNGISIIIFAGIARGFAECDRWVCSSWFAPVMHPFTALVHLHPGGAGDGFRGVRRAWAAQDPGELREAAGRQQGVWRAELASAA